MVRSSVARSRALLTSSVRHATMCGHRETASTRGKQEPPVLDRRARTGHFFLAIASILLPSGTSALQAQTAAGVVSHVKVVSDKVEDVASLDDWKQAFI